MQNPVTLYHLHSSCCGVGHHHSCLNFCSGLLTGLPVSPFVPLRLVSASSRVSLFKMEIDRITRGSQFCSDLPILLTIKAEDLTVIHRVLSDPAWPRLPLPFCSLSTASGLPVQGLCPGGPWGPGALVPLVTVWVIPSSPWPTWSEWKLRSSPLQHSASLSLALLCSIALITH